MKDEVIAYLCNLCRFDRMSADMVISDLERLGFKWMQPDQSGRHFDDLTQIPSDCTVGDLDEDTRKRIKALPQEQREWFYNRSWRNDISNYILDEMIFRQKPAPKMRKMTQAECLGWAFNEGAAGWQVQCPSDAWRHPSDLTYANPDYEYKRRQIATDGTVGEPIPFEVEA